MKSTLHFLLIISVLLFTNLVANAEYKDYIKTADPHKKALIPWIKNIGQFNSNIAFTSKTFVADVLVKNNNDIEYVLNSSDEKTKILRESFLSNKQHQPTGIRKSDIRINYFSNQKSFNNIPTFNSLYLGEIWNNIEVNLVTTNNNFEKIFELGSNANVEDIKIRINGAIDICENENEELQVDFDNDNISFTKPIAWQIIDGERVDIDVNYSIRSDEDLSYGFELGEYNNQFPVVIDPLLSSGFLGGNSLDFAKKISIGNSDKIYVAGSTSSFDFPTTEGIYDSLANGTFDVFVALFSNDFSELKACTFIGGSDDDYLFDMVLDGQNNVYFTGSTKSDNYPTTLDAFDTTYNSPGEKRHTDMMVSMLNNSLDTLVYSTYVGNDLDDDAVALDIDPQGDIIVTGSSEEGILSVGTQFNALTRDFVFFKMDRTLSTILASNSITLDSLIVPTDLSIDDNGNVFITGNTNSSDFPTTTGCYLDTLTGKYDIFILKLNNSLSSISAATYFGGRNIDLSTTIKTKGGNIFITGSTMSPRFPISPNSYDTLYAYNPNKSFPDAFLSSIKDDLKELNSSTFIGGLNDEIGTDIAFDANDYIYLIGTTTSSDFPVFCNSYQDVNKGLSDCFIGKFNPSMDSLKTATYFGGSRDDHAYSVDISDSSNLFIVGYTQSINLTTQDAYDNNYNGGIGDGMLFEMTSNLDKPYPCCSELITPIPGSSENFRELKIRWRRATGATGYYLTLGTSENSDDILARYNTGSATSHIVYNLPCGDSIFVKINPYNDYGVNENCESFWFKTVEPFLEKETMEICNGDSVSWRGNTYFQDSLYEEKFIDGFGCDSIYALDLIVHDSYFKIDTVIVCEGESYNWINSTYTQSGIYTISDTTEYGCDSVHVLDLTIHPVFSEKQIVHLCEGESYTWQNETFDSSGVYKKVYIDYNGCDSTYQLSLFIEPKYYFSENMLMCEGDSIDWHNKTITAKGNYYADYSTIYGCDSIYHVSVTYFPSSTDYINAEVCDGDTVFISGVGYSNAGVYERHYQNSYGCDSAIIISLAVNPSYNLYDTAYICQGDTLVVDGNSFFEQGNHIIENQTENGCDSITNLFISYLPNIYENDTLSICQNDTLYWKELTITQTGEYIKLQPSDITCDTIFKLIVYVNSSYSFYDSIAICDGEVIEWEGQTIDIGGDYSSKYQTINGCDSIYNLHVVINPVYEFVEEQTICENDTFLWNGFGLTVPGQYFAFYKTVEGCDSTYHLTLNQTIINSEINNNEDTLYAEYDVNATYQWVKCPSIDPIPNATSNIYIAEESGSYAVIITNGNCEELSNCIDLIHSDVEDIKQKMDVLVYPNPIKNELLTVKLLNYTSNYSINIYNLNGKELLSINKANGIAKIDISNFEAGVYLMSLNNGEAKVFRKIVVMK